MLQRATTDEIAAAYREAGSVWKAAKQLGMSGQAVHERLVAIGQPLTRQRWTDDETDELRRLVEGLVPVGEIARRLGRPYASVASKASELGVRSLPQRERKVPRGAGYDKAAIKRHVVALWRFDGTVTQYARANQLAVEAFVKAYQRHFPESWADYVASRGALATKTCAYCEDDFYPRNGNQEFCTTTCSADARRDESYFGGKRRNTIGLRAGVCQLCGGGRSKGLSSHHVLGRQNDPANDVLIALCRGCHQLVSQLGGRKFADDPAAWEALISLVWLRRHGTTLTADGSLWVRVEIDADEPAGRLAA